MSETVDALLCEMLSWLAREARSYAEVMEAWRTSCPRLPVWEDATERKRGEAEQSRLRSMLENSPTNVMLADLDLKITYVNPASLSLLRKLERQLGFFE